MPGGLKATLTVLAAPIAVAAALLVTVLAAASTTVGATAAVAAACVGQAPPATAPPPAGDATPQPSTSSSSSSAPDGSGCTPGDTEGDGLPAGGGTVSLPAGYTYPPAANALARAAISFAIAQLGEPYLWGGTGPDAWDCSGLMQAAWAAAGVAISRTTLTQVHDGTPVSSIAALSPGDLILIAGSEGTLANPRHVGMYMGRGLIVEAPHTGDVVKIVPLSSWEPLIAAMRHIA